MEHFATCLLKVRFVVYAETSLGGIEDRPRAADLVGTEEPSSCLAWADHKGKARFVVAAYAAFLGTMVREDELLAICSRCSSVDEAG